MRAEAATAAAVLKKYPGAAEEQISFLFGGELRVQVEEASDAGEVESAFLADLLSIRDVDVLSIPRGRGLIARVNFHNRQHEGRHSASDLGVIIKRPRVGLGGFNSTVEMLPDYARGLLAQAKLGRQANLERTYQFGSLTKSQERLIPKHSEYFSILLYRLAGADADRLAPFDWQLCKGHSVPEIKGWLSSGIYPAELSSEDIIEGLFACRIGTDDRAVLEEIVDPAGGQGIDLEIFWPDGAPPPPILERNYQNNRQTQTLKICQ